MGFYLNKPLTHSLTKLLVKFYFTSNKMRFFAAILLISLAVFATIDIGEANGRGKKFCEPVQLHVDAPVWKRWTNLCKPMYFRDRPLQSPARASVEISPRRRLQLKEKETNNSTQTTLLKQRTLLRIPRDPSGSFIAFYNLMAL